MAVAQPGGFPAGGMTFDILSAADEAASEEDLENQWSIPALDDADDDGPKGAQLRLRLLKLKLKVPI
ncbi:hypothetical protein [Sphingomonas sp. Root1294]|nr:hypothetical protein [Sphingomonas sp. Root1294]KQX20272.1 hypothetical protein ASD17_10435 [Sphingomonas sp. Root1294]KQY67522.1 hypothetical protein ASD39_10495 [Sphingomonas sp. Root50]